jgi:hypothetical protein
MIPTYGTGFARTAADSEAPELWRGLIGAWLPFLGPTGDTLHDWGGGKFSGTLTSMELAADWVVDDGGYALAFDGSAEYVNIPDTAKLRPGESEWSISLWFWAANATQVGPIMCKRLNSSPYNQLNFEVGTITTSGGTTASKKLSVVQLESWSGATRFHVTDDDVVDGNWHHAVLVRPTSGAPSVYVDGEDMAMTQIQANGSEPMDISNTSPWRIGSDNGAQYFGGRVSAVLMYDRCLTAVEVQSLYIDRFSMWRERAPVFGIVAAAGVSIPVFIHHYKQAGGL